MGTLVCGHGPRRAAVGQGETVDKAFSAPKEALEPYYSLSHNGADVAHARTSILLSISVPSRDRHGLSFVSVQGLVEESGVRHGLFRDRLPLWSG